MSIFVWPNGLTTPPPFSWQGHFGWRNADLVYASRYHRGQDFYDFTKVCAIADGEVVRVGRYAGWEGGGVMVWIQHDGFFSRSLHLEEGSPRVRVGQTVKAGQHIGTVGNTNGGAAGMARHLHLEITEGQWHAYNSGQIDPRAFLEARVGTTSGAGGSAAAPTTPTTTEEDDDMALFRITNGNWKGRHYALDTEYIKMIGSKESVQSSEKVRKRTEIAVTEAEFRVELGIAGVPSNVLDHRGYILNDLEGKNEYVSGGSWSRAQKNERALYVLQKNLKK